MRDPSDPADRTAALVSACLMEAARGRARTAAHLRVSGPGALPLVLAQGLFTAVAALAVLRLFGEPAPGRDPKHGRCARCRSVSALLRRLGAPPPSPPPGRDRR